MKLFGLFLAAAITLLAGCAEHRGGTGSSTDSYRGNGNLDLYRGGGSNDLNDMGYLNQSENIGPYGQPRVPDRPIDIVNEPQ